MSESSDSNDTKVESDSSDARETRNQVKKYRLKRKGNQLKISPSVEELNYRKNFSKFNVITDFPLLVCCTKCQTSFEDDILKGNQIYSHPLLDVLMCESCCVFYGDGQFSLDEDGEDKYCRWCGQGGKLFLCSKCICGFCPKCIKTHFGIKKVNDIRKDDDWICYFCNPEPLWKLRNVCHLAKKQAQEKRNENSKNVGTPREKNGKEAKKNEIVSSDKDDKDGSKDNSGDENLGKRKFDSKENSKDVNQDRRGFGYVTRRTRHYQQSLTIDNTSSSSVPSLNDYSEPARKKRKITRRSSAKGEPYFINGDKRKKSKKAISSPSENSSSESEVEEAEYLSYEKGVKETKKLVRNKQAEKLKEILKIAEVTAELCGQLCKKKLRKLEKKDCMVMDDKIISDCEKLKSMIILMSSSLSTVHNMIISLQRKFGAKGLDSVFHGVDDPSFLKTISHIFMDKRVKTSHLIKVVNDLIYNFPCVALGSNITQDSVWENDTSFLSCNRDGNDRQKDPEISDASFCGTKTNDNMVNGSPKNSVDGFANSDSLCLKELSQTLTPGQKACSVVSTVSLKLDNHTSRASDDQSSNSPVTKRNNAQKCKVLRRDSSDFEENLKWLSDNSFKLKEQLLRNSSDESSSECVEISDSSSTDGGRKGTASKRQDGRRTKRKQLTSEEREIRRLTNLKSLDRGIRSYDSDSETSCESSSSNRRRTDRKNADEDGDKSISDTISLKSDSSQSLNEILQPAGHQNEIDFFEKCSSLLKEYILQSTGSESEVEEELKEGKSESNKMKSRSHSKKDRSSRESTSEESSIKDRPWKRRKKNKSKLSSSTDTDDVEEVVRGSPSNSENPGKGRKTIRKILKTGNLELGTRQAIKAENERKKRMAERNEIYKKFFPNMTNSNRVILDFDRETGEVLVEVPKPLVKHLKPHQKEGIKFMWDNCFESLASLEEHNGSGCILAHCMGLGKTLQIISLIATVMKNNVGVDTVLILCPLNVINNWIQEFKLWLKNVNFELDVYNIVKCRRDEQRFYKIRQWHTEGGVLVLGYDMLRSLTKVKRNSRNQTQLVAELSKFLLDPGADLVICDEGHVLKNEDSSLTMCVRRIKTARRIVLTGTPFQNNLLEYHSMVQLIKPNILGTKKEFMNRFVNPIRNGQFEDSTASDVKLMRARAHVLHKLLDGCIQRFNYSVLTPFLPEKHEYVISVRLTDTQAKLYRYYAEMCRDAPASEKGAKFFTDFHWLQKIWSHPRIFRSFMEERETSKNAEDGANSSTDESVICIEPDSSENAYWKEVIREEECEKFSGSGKLLILFDILNHCRKLGDKVLVFSQSLKNLNLIEEFLAKVNSANIAVKRGEKCEDIPPEYLDTWIEGEDYFRMDGSTGSDERSNCCRYFNSKKDPRARLFLISTKAGGLGINLVGANRVVLFDASWNPSHDVQSIFRVYRFGQSKPCYIYRLVAEATMEEKIYERQVTKLSLEKRVLDEHQIERRYTMGTLQALYKYDPLPRERWPVPMVPKDVLLAEILKIRRNVIVNYHEHDSLLENKEEEELTEEERKTAWEDFEKERFMIENELERTRLIVQRNDPDVDKLTREVLMITQMYKSGSSDVRQLGYNPPMNNIGMIWNFPQASTSRDAPGLPSGTI